MVNLDCDLQRLVVRNVRFHLRCETDQLRVQATQAKLYEATSTWDRQKKRLSTVTRYF